MLGWGLAMAALWGAIPFLMGGGVGLFIMWDKVAHKTSQLFGPADGGLGFAFFLAGIAAVSGIMCIWSLGGLITGVVAGFYAPAVDPRNPWRSQFFRRLGRNTFWHWFFANLIAIPVLICLGEILIPDFKLWLMFPNSLIFLCLIVAVTFIGSLWDAVSAVMND